MADGYFLRNGILRPDASDDINDGSLLWLPLAERGGLIARDISGRNNHGTLTNGPVWDGGGLKFDGTNDYVSVLDSPALDPGGAASWMISFRTNVAQSGRPIWMHDQFLGTSSSTYKWIAGYVTSSSTAIHTFVRIGGTAYSAGGAASILGKPSVYVGTFDRTLSSARLKTYFDGVLVGSHDAANGDIDSGDLNDIGRWLGSSAVFFGGTVATLRMWNRALSTPEVQQLTLNPNRGLWVPGKTRYYLPAAGAYILSADPGAMAITGASASPLSGRMLSATAGAMSITGAGASTLAGRIISADAGVMNIAGTNAAAIADRIITASPGSISITGLGASVLADRLLSAAPGAIVLTGFAADLLATTSGAYILSADPGAMAIVGAAANALAGRTITALPGSITITGAGAGVIADRILSAEPGAYAVVGASASAISARILSADPGAYVITGLSATFDVPALATYAVEIVVLGDAREIVIIGDARDR